MQKRRTGRLLQWAFICSLLLHFTILPLLIWLLRFQSNQFKTQPVERISVSSALRLERRVRQRAARTPRPAPRRVEHRVARRQPVHEKRLLARITPRARITLPRLTHTPTRQQTFAQSLQRDEKMFVETIARLRSQNNPVVSAARPVPSPEAPKRYQYNFAGSMTVGPIAEGILYPEKSWNDQGYIYYYVRYYVEYPDGTTETGVVPWPLRYTPQDDPFARHIEHIPLPGPLPGYSLPAGTILHPLVAFCFAHHFDSCPIAHD